MEMVLGLYADPICMFYLDLNGIHELMNSRWRVLGWPKGGIR